MSSFVEDIKSILLWGRKEAYQKINTSLIEACSLTEQRIMQEKLTDNTLPKNTEDILKTISKVKANTRFDTIKDPYVFEFLNIPQSENDNEKNLETLLIDDLQKFLLELGKGFSFVGRQFRISTETTHFYVDLVFYNYILKCFVLVDLKIDKLSHQDIGQMDMYIRMFDDLKRGEDDNPTIGIILCADKDETMVKYSVLEEHKQLFASKYLTYLPTEEELLDEIEYVKSLSEKNRG